MESGTQENMCSQVASASKDAGTAQCLRVKAWDISSGKEVCFPLELALIDLCRSSLFYILRVGYIGVHTVAQWHWQCPGSTGTQV